MFSFLKSDPVKKLKKDYQKKLAEAMSAQRNGDIKTYSKLTGESEKIWAEIQILENSK